MNVTKRTQSKVVFGVCLGLALIVATSCEDSIDSGVNEGVSTPRPQTTLEFVTVPNGLTIVPGAVTVVSTPGATVKFSVSGGRSPYTWSASQGALGSINSSGLYIASPDTEGENKITARDSSGKAVVATITQTRLNKPVDSTSPLAMYPSTLAPIIVTNEPVPTIQFAASGGVPPYTWSVSFSSLGTVDQSGLYTPKKDGFGDNTIYLRDSAGSLDLITVDQN